MNDPALPSPLTLQLIAHPATPCPPVQAVEVTLRWQGAAELLLRYCIRARMAALRVPAPEPPAPAEGLWQHLCLEAFIGVDGNRYHEFNFSPSGRWAAFAFSATRVRDAVGPTLAIQPRLQLAQTEAALTLTAVLPLAALAGCSAWQVGLAAVIEPRQGPLSYWALAHPAPRPDFHHRAGWTLRLAPSPLP